MSFRCDNCGSKNHLARDCSKAYNGWREREPVEVVAKPIEQPAPKVEELRGVDPERWPGGPKICRKTNRPSFPDDAAASAYFKRYCPGMTERKRAACSACGGIHVAGYFHTEKALSEPLRKNFKPFIRPGFWEEARRNWVGKSRK